MALVESKAEGLRRSGSDGMTSLSRLQEPPNSTIGRAEKRVERVLEKYLTKGARVVETKMGPVGRNARCRRAFFMPGLGQQPCRSLLSYAPLPQRYHPEPSYCQP